MGTYDEKKERATHVGRWRLNAPSLYTALTIEATASCRTSHRLMSHYHAPQET